MEQQLYSHTQYMYTICVRNSSYTIHCMMFKCLTVYIKQSVPHPLHLELIAL